MAKTSPNQWSITRADNSDIDGINIAEGCPAGNMNDAVREIMVQVKEQLGGLNVKGTDIASATTTDLATATANVIDITGTTTITGLGTVAAGQVFILQFDGALTLTHNATSLKLPGAANITTAAGDVAVMVSEGSGNWRCVSYQRSTYVPPVITPWVAYTPTLVGFGTPSGVTFYSRRVGSNLEIFARFAAGTSTATEARIPIGFNGTEANVTISSLMNSAVWTVGLGGINITAASQYFLIALGGATYLRIGLQSSGRAALTAVDANVALPSSGNTLAFTASVPIEGWQ